MYDATEFDIDEPTYKIVKFFKAEGKSSEVIHTGLTLEAAQSYCNDPDTKSEDWFCGYKREN